MKIAGYCLIAFAALPTFVVGQGAVTEAKRDDVASGVIVLETPTEIRVNITPCSNAGNVVVFYQPFNKVKLGTVTCGSRTLDRFQVEKR
jgi:hypothetical protein